MPLVDFSVFGFFEGAALASSAELAVSDEVTFRLLRGIVGGCGFWLCLDEVELKIELAEDEM